MKKGAALFVISAGLVLVALGMLHVLGNQGNVLQPADPVSGISSRHVFWIMGILELLVAAVCLFGRPLPVQSFSILWVSTTILLYRGALWFYGVKTIRAYYDTEAASFSVSVDFVNVANAIGIFYLWMGSAVLIFLHTKSRPLSTVESSRQPTLVNP